MNFQELPVPIICNFQITNYVNVCNFSDTKKKIFDQTVSQTVNKSNKPKMVLLSFTSRNNTYSSSFFKMEKVT